MKKLNIDSMEHKAVFGVLCFVVFILFVVMVTSVKAEDLQEEFSINTEFKMLGKNSKIVVYSFQDQDYPVSCFISHAETGGITGTIGIAEDPSRFSLQCVKSSNISNLPFPKNSEVKKIMQKSTSIFFKKTTIYRYITDDVMVYMAVSDKLIDGSPYNSISVISKY